MIDLATQGRRMLGVGVGYQVPDVAAFDVSIAERAARTAEALAILRHCGSGHRFSVAGQYVHDQDTLMTPVPWQRPGPPVWMAAWSPAGWPRAARLADGWLPSRCTRGPSSNVRASRDRAAAVEAGRTPCIGLMRDAVIANRMAEAEAPRLRPWRRIASTASLVPMCRISPSRTSRGRRSLVYQCRPGPFDRRLSRRLSSPMTAVAGGDPAG